MYIHWNGYFRISPSFKMYWCAGQSRLDVVIFLHQGYCTLCLYEVGVKSWPQKPSICIDELHRLRVFSSPSAAGICYCISSRARLPPYLCMHVPLFADIELKPGGADIEVTDANKHEFVKLACDWRLTRGRLSIPALWAACVIAVFYFVVSLWWWFVLYVVSLVVGCGGSLVVVCVVFCLSKYPHYWYKRTLIN